MLNILNYINIKDQEIRFYYNEELDRLIKWNLDTKQLKEIENLPQNELIQQLLEITLGDFKEVTYISEILLKILDEEIELILSDKVDILLNQIEEFKSNL